MLLKVIKKQIKIRKPYSQKVTHKEDLSGPGSGTLIPSIFNTVATIEVLTFQVKEGEGGLLAMMN